jgi:hypothetical protein
MTSTFGNAMFARIGGEHPGYMARTPHILAPRNVSPPSILGDNRVAHSRRCSSWPFSAEALARIDGGFPEYRAETPSTLRYASGDPQ